MRTFLLALATLTTTALWSQEVMRGDPILINERPIFKALDFIIQDTIQNKKLKKDEAVFHFDLQNLFPADSGAIAHFSIDTTEYLRPLKSGRLSVKTTPGYHSFQIYVNDNYLEAYSSMLNIEGQTELVYNVLLNHRQFNEPVMTFKPVIYLYPTEKTEVSVSIDIHKGENEFYYPKYKDSWTCTAKPNGELLIKNQQYRYLFWEAQQPDHLKEIDVNEGFIVDGSESISFLEDKLSLFGLTTEEQADFITFWGPLMAKNERNLVRFEWNENCDKFADLHISPQPDKLYRIYIFIAPLQGDLTVKPQLIPQMDRSGFVAIEWGGQLSNYQPNKVL